MEISLDVARWVRDLECDVDSVPRLKRPCLLALDLQNDFLRPDGQLQVWGGADALPHVQRLLGVFRRHSLPVIFTRHICIEPHAHRENLKVAQYIRDPDNFLRDGHIGGEIHEAVRPLSGETVIPKFSYSAFYDTPLGTLLRVWRISEVVITGVATNICCETTAHDAFFRGFDVVFTIDATGGTSEQAHLASLRNIQMSYGRIALASAVEAAIKGGHSA